MKKIGLTGVTGNLGRNIAEQLKDLGASLKMIARSPQRAPEIPGAETAKASYEDSEESVMALQGIDVLFMVSGKENAHRLEQHKAFIDAAKKAGVRHIIYTSFYNAAPDCTFTLGRDHDATEQHIKDLGFTYTFIRDNFYMDFFVELMREYGELRGPAGDGKVSAVVRSDVAEVIVKILRDPALYENQTLNMTGPKEYTLSEMAEIASKKLGKEIAYINETDEEAYKSRAVYNAEDWEMASWVSTYQAIRNGETAGLSQDIPRILGREAKDLESML